MNSSPNGLAKVKSARSFADTLARFESLLESTGLTLFAKIDFSGDAGRLELKMPPCVMLLFGSPKAATPVILAVPDIAIDLPMKVLISEDNEGAVWLIYNEPEYVSSRHSIPENLAPNLAAIRPLVKAAAQ